jgi:hypothetical protein
MSKTVWIAGTIGCGSWELLGVYSTRELAVSNCFREDNFVATMSLDAPAMSETETFEGLEYFPFEENNENQGELNQ